MGPQRTAASGRGLAVLCSLLALTLGCDASTQPLPAFFDDMSYRSAGHAGMNPRDESMLGIGSWLTSPSGERLTGRGWRLGWDDDHYRGDAGRRFGGPSHVTFVGDGNERALRLVMGAGFPAHARPPQLNTALAFGPRGTYAVRVRFGELDPAQRQVQAFWLTTPDEFRFCPEDRPNCDVRSLPAGGMRVWSEVDFELHNWFYPRAGTFLTAGAAAFRSESDDFEAGFGNAPLDCVRGRARLAECVLGDGRSGFSNRWIVLVYRLDPASGELTFAVEDDDPTASTRLEAAPPTRPPGPLVLTLTKGSRPGLPERFRPSRLLPRDSVTINLSLHYAGPHDPARGRTCTASSGAAVTCREHGMEVDWVYYTPSLLSVDQIKDQVFEWRRRGEVRVNTTGVQPLTPNPPPASAGPDSASIALVLQGPTRTAREAEWTVWPSRPRGIIYKMDVEAITACHSAARQCRPRVIRPMSNVLRVEPAQGESGMVIRARLKDPWWGYTHVPSPGSSWREWTVTFDR